MDVRDADLEPSSRPVLDGGDAGDDRRHDVRRRLAIGGEAKRHREAVAGSGLELAVDERAGTKRWTC